MAPITRPKRRIGALAAALLLLGWYVHSSSVPPGIGAEPSPNEAGPTAGGAGAKVAPRDSVYVASRIRSTARATGVTRRPDHVGRPQTPRVWTVPFTPRPAGEVSPGEIHTDIPESVAPDSGEESEPIAVELRAGHLASRILVARRYGDALQLPAKELLDLMGAPYRTRADTIVAIRQPGERAVVLAPGDQHGAVLLRGQLYVPITALAREFGARATVLWDDAAVQLDEIDSLPIAVQAARQQRRARLLTETAVTDPPAEPEGLVSPSSRGLALDYAAGFSSDNPLSEGTYEVGITNGLLDGRLYTHLSTGGGVPSQVRGDWLRVWNDRSWIRQLRLGDGMTGGPRPRSLRGLAVTNAPYARPIVVEQLPFTGTLPPDWSIEAYRAGQLVSFDSVAADGHYSLVLPVHYGENPTEFLAYGPFGEVRTFNRTFRALPEMLPAGRMEYSGALGDCRRIGCSATGNLDLRYGVTRHWTVRAGIDREWDSTGAGGYMYAAALGVPTNAFGVELETLRGVSDRAGLRLEPNSGLRVTADWIGYRAGARAPFAPPGARSTWALATMIAPGRREGGLTWEGRLGRTAAESETRTDFQLGPSIRSAAALVRPFVRAERVAREAGGSNSTMGYAGFEVTALPRLGLPKALAGIWIRADGELDSRGAASRAGITASKNVAGLARLEAGIRWTRSAGGMVSLGFVTQSSSVRASTLASKPLTGTGRVEQHLSGSVAWDPSAGGVIFSAEPAAERGGVTGSVFLDQNANGSRDPSEPLLPQTRVLVAGQWLVTDSAGRFSRWGISPYERVSIAIDSASLRFPWWVPLASALELQMEAGRFREVSLPVVSGATVEGSVRWEGSQGSPAGLTLRLRNLQTGAIRPLPLFSDGSFYEVGIPPGDYELTGTLVGASGGTESASTRLTVPAQSVPGRDSTEPLLLSGLSIVLRPEAKPTVAAQPDH